MGRSSPSPPTIIMPEQADPIAFQTIIPQKSYRDLAESIGRTTGDYNKFLKRRFDSVGTPREMGARKAANRLMETSSYESSLPGQSRIKEDRFLETPREFPIRSNNRSTFDTRPGKTAGKNKARRLRGGGKIEKTSAQKAASMLTKDAMSGYRRALKRVEQERKKGRKSLFLKYPKNPGFAKNKDEIFAPKDYES